MLVLHKSGDRWFRAREQRNHLRVSTAPTTPPPTPLRGDIPAAPLALRRELIARGFDDNTIARMVRRGELVRIRQGAYTDPDWWESAPDPVRHLLRARAVMARAESDAVLSHTTAVLAHGGPTWSMPLADVHVTRRDQRAGRREAGVVQHRGLLPDDDITSCLGMPTTSAVRTVVDAITRTTAEIGLVVANDFLHRELCTREDLLGHAETIVRWPGSLERHTVLRLATPLCESVGESRLLHLIHRYGLPMPELQLTIYEEDGRLVARLDFAWPEYGLFVEFDGLEKYLRPWRPGEDAAAVVVREDAVRRITGWRCIRLTWADLERPLATAQRLGRALGVVPIVPVAEARAQRF